ncbi:hypothetical protein DL96DRAFT_553003 [Flagelloscypha sp. PMI_526]|nr:hypothetical protein DL96DRAFT_553003 [Flagelloscypha sp. PMI_526]
MAEITRLVETVALRTSEVRPCSWLIRLLPSILLLSLTFISKSTASYTFSKQFLPIFATLIVLAPSILDVDLQKKLSVILCDLSWMVAQSHHRQT